MSDEKELIAVEEQPDGGATVELPDSIPSPDGEKEVEVKAEGGEVEAPQEDEDHQDDTDEIRQAKRERRRARKEYHKRISKERDVELDKLRRDNQQLLERLAAVERKTQSHDLARVNAELSDQQAKMQFAQQKMKEAIETGNGELHAKATELYYEARRAAEVVENQKKALTQTVRQPSQPDPRVQKLAADWLADNPWYNPTGQDADSEVAMAVDKALVRDGWNPSDPDYWDELDRRLQRYIPHRYTDHMDDRPSEKPRRSAVVGSGRESAVSSGGRANTFTLSPDQVRVMKEAGFWDNPELRAKMIKRYAEEARKARS